MQHRTCLTQMALWHDRAENVHSLQTIQKHPTSLPNYSLVLTGMIIFYVYKKLKSEKYIVSCITV